ncbi:HK97 family phage prohead protease [Alteriqipengyuania lutimaris]|nr:HK97 family phage prohead protease [Alteriqipengyuania lutimaris]MBB3034047.1 hypothetical protein [Alteriqipengyuania lutimaris]
MDALDFPLDIKSIDADGAIEGIASGYGNLDFGGDVMLPGAIGKSLEGRKSIPMLLFHDQRRPVGVWREWTETSEGLHVKGRFSMSSVAGQDAHAMTKDGALGGLSVGYRTLKDRVIGKARQLVEVALHEISLVTIPMNSKALITNVKDIAGEGKLPTLPEFEDFLREAGFSKSQATAIAGKGLSHLLRGEPGSASDDEAREFLATLSGHSPA